MSPSATDIWGVDFGPVVAILALGLVSYALRAGGFWIMGRVPLRPFVQRMLAALPGSIIAATVLPIVASGGLVAGLSVGAGAVAMLALRNDFAAVLTGMAVAAAARAAGLD
ncbi:branched-chain amino acid transport [Rhodovulum sp. PH10]|uniref:AzlD family protein n=1 Tax=Rhodovulum sp. PH10 TaxID=1187851 RepID=UPI00027C1E04|nr:AzlD domain-containing protein [Rhodovulum sp. PH10]EJW12491.1 branched-chain amino acid transport [Rhodovulum sp. PH10]